MPHADPEEAADPHGARARRPFPLRVAAVDIGSNAIRLMAVEFYNRKYYHTLAAERVSIRLGRYAFRDGRFPPEVMDEVVAACERFRELMHALQIAAHRAVATSAMRDSANGRELAERIRAEAGLALEVISGAEEVSLVYEAVKNRVALGSAPWMLTDLGGGSVEVSLIDHAAIRFSGTYPFGAVRLLEQEAWVRDDAGAVLCGELARQMPDLVEELARTEQLAGCIATGGNIDALAHLARIERHPWAGGLLPTRLLRKTLENVLPLSVPQRVKKLHLRRDRADVIVPAARVYLCLAQFAQVQEIHVPGVGLKHGLLYDLVNRHLRAAPPRSAE